MEPSLTQHVWTWYLSNANEHEAEGLWKRLEPRLRADPGLFHEGWPEAQTRRKRSLPSNMCVLHAVCMLKPVIAIEFVRRLSKLPGFFVEQRTDNGVTPLVAAVYNRYGTRVQLIRALLDLGANPNSPADAIEKVNSKQPIKRKPALAHLLVPCTSIFGREGAFPTRSTHDTDSIKELVERGAHFGASYSCRPMTVVQEFRYGNERYRDGHCLPYQMCYRNHGNGHGFRDLMAETPESPSVDWLGRLLRRHCRETKVGLRLQSNKKLRLTSNNPGLPVYKPIRQEVYWFLYCLSRTNIVPEDLHGLILQYLVPTYPYAGFYDATRLERLWNRQRSPYIDTGYVVPMTRRFSAGDQAEFRRLEASLRSTMQPIFYGQSPQVKVDVDPACFGDVAILAAGLYGTVSSICPDAYSRVISPKISRVGLHEESIWYMASSPEEVQRQLILGYIASTSTPRVQEFALWLCVQLLRGAVRRVYEAFKAQTCVDRSTYKPLSIFQVSSVAEQFKSS